MSEVTFNSLLFRIAGKLEEINAREHVVFMCHGKIEHRDDETILSKFKKLKEGGFLGVDSLQMLKDILKAEKQWDFLAEIGEFETTRGEYKKLLEKIIGALENHNDLERLTSFIWERYNVPEERRNDVRSLVQVLEEMNVIGVDGLNLFTEPFINLNNDELLAELKDFQNRRTKDEKSGRRTARAAAVWSFAGAVCQRIIGVLKVHCTLRNVVTGCSVTFGIVQLLRGSSTWQDFLELLGQAFPEETRVLGLSEGSVCFMVQAETSLALEELYERYSTGRLQKDLQKFLVTDDIRQLADGEEVVVLVNIDEKEFREARDDLINVDKEEADHDAQPTQFHEVEGDDLSQTAQETSSGEADGTPLFSQQGDLYPETSMIGKATAGVEEEVLDNQEDTDWLTRTEKARRKMASEPNANVVADLNKALMNANSGDDKNETALLMMSPSMNWAEFLTPAPFYIALMGQLILVEREKDISLENQRPEEGFQFIRHPESFGACLLHVSASGWRAFNKAHKNMDAIRLYSAQVPNQVKKVVRTLVTGSAKDVEDFLPIELGEIDRNATKCLRLAQAVEAKFEHVMDLTGELLEVSSAAKGHYEKSQEELEIKRKIDLAKEEAVRKKLEDAKEQKEKLENQVKEAKAGWEKAVDSLPNGWCLVGMQFAESLTRTVSNAASTLLPLMAMKPFGTLVQMSTVLAQKLKGTGPSTQQTPTDVQDVPPSVPLSVPPSVPASVPPSVPPSVNTEKLMILITKLAEDVSSAFEKGLKETKDERSAPNEIKTAKIQMKGLKEEWSSKEDSPDKEQALQLLTSGLKICTEALSSLEQLNRSPEEMEEIPKQALKLQRDVNAFCIKARAKAGQNPFYTKPPVQATKMINSANSFSSRVAESSIESARFKIAEARGLLERQENLYDQTCKELKESNEELSKALQSLSKFSPKKIANFDQIRETLSQGLVALASVRAQWQKLVEIFQFITNIIKVCQKESLSSFVEYAKVGQKRVLANGYASTDFMRDLIYEQVSQANTTSYVVWSISNTYVEISRDHLMSQIASLGDLVALDLEKDRIAIEEKRKELMEGSQEAQEAIMKKVSEAKDHFHEKVAKRVKKIETELLKALPSEDPAKIKEIIDSVKNAIKEADEELDADKF